MTFVASLEPTAVWSHFDEILTIPRGSKNEERMRKHVLAVAEKRGLAHRVDGAGNVVVRKPANSGREEAPVVILQSHLDMVNEKNADVSHDFSADPIEPRRDGEYLKATGTTLGSDNGIGVAAMLAVLEDGEIRHGPLELLFTIDEETGLTGAAQLDAGMLEGRRLLNLDSEEEGIVYVGCAGGGDSTIELPLVSSPTPEGWEGWTIKVFGLRGGHSGGDIHLQRANAIKVLARCLLAAGGGFRLARFVGGGVHNAIPREAFADVVLPAGGGAAFEKAFLQELDAVRNEYRAAEPDIRLELEGSPPGGEAWEADATMTVLNLVTGLPHGVLAMSHEIEDLVETSTNLATVRPGNGSLTIGMSSRSSIDTALEAVRGQIRATASLAGASVEEDVAYPGWKPNLESDLLRAVKEVHARELGREPEVKAIHAGLECGVIGKKVPGIDMISFGPQIEFPHSPDERVHVDSVGRFYRLLGAVLESLD